MKNTLGTNVSFTLFGESHGDAIGIVIDGLAAGIKVDEGFMDKNDRFDLASAGLIAYCHGEYFALGKKLGKFGYSVQKKKKEKKRNNR